MTRDRQPELFEAEHTSTVPNRRLTNYAEEVFAREWEKENLGTASRCPTLQLLLGRIPNQDEAEAAAEVIQWLGTNVGCGFLWKCEKEIKEVQNFEHGWWEARHPDAKPMLLGETDRAIATMLARDLWGMQIESLEKLEDAIDLVTRIICYARTGRC